MASLPLAVVQKSTRWGCKPAWKRPEAWRAFRTRASVALSWQRQRRKKRVVVRRVLMKGMTSGSTNKAGAAAVGAVDEEGG